VDILLGNVSKGSGDELVGKAPCSHPYTSVGTDFIIVCNDDKKPSATTLPGPTYNVVRVLLVGLTLEIPDLCVRPIKHCVKEEYRKEKTKRSGGDGGGA
jgi:hypothetical protein